MNIKKSDLPRSYDFTIAQEIPLCHLIEDKGTKEAFLQIAYSFARRLSGSEDEAERMLLHEWDLLAAQRVCKSKPPMWMLKAAGVKPV